MPLEAHFSDGGAGTNVTGAVLGVDFLWGETQTAVYAAMVHMETSAGPEHGTSRGEGIGLGGKFGRTLLRVFGLKVSFAAASIRPSAAARSN